MSVGLPGFAVWLERDLENDKFRIKKIEPYDPQKSYPKDVSGVVHAKDELDVYRLINLNRYI